MEQHSLVLAQSAITTSEGILRPCASLLLASGMPIQRENRVDGLCSVVRRRWDIRDECDASAMLLCGNRNQRLTQYYQIAHDCGGSGCESDADVAMSKCHDHVFVVFCGSDHGD